MKENHKLFCLEYIKDFNGTRAYKEVYKNCSITTARKNSNKLLKRADISQYIREQTEKIHNDKIADVEEIRELLTEIARGETTKGATVVVEAIGGGLTKAREVNKKPEDKDRLKALELLGKANSLFTDKLDATASIDISVDIEDSLEDNEG